MNALAAQLDPFIAEVQQHWGVPGLAIAVVRRDGPVLVRAYGVRDVATSVPTDIATTFAIGSCTKAFTSGVAAALVDADVIGWDDPIRKYLPSFKLHDCWISDRVTLRDVLANRTGLSRASVAEYGSDLSRAEVLRQARHVQPIAGFRDQFTYSNIGYVIAAEAMAMSVGHSFDRVMDEYLLRPLGLRGREVSDAARATNNIAAPHYQIDGKVQSVPSLSFDNLLGAVGHSMSAQEAATWLAFHLEQGGRGGVQVISQQQLRETHLLQTVRRDRTANDGYGLGWHVRNQRIQHDGTVRGFRTNIWCDLEGGVAIFVATNIGSGFAHFAVTNRIIQAMRGEPFIDWITYFDDMARVELSERVARFDKERLAEPISASRWSQNDFVGTYRHEGFGLLHVEPRSDYLWFRIDGLSGFDGPLMRYSSLSFEYQGDRDAMAWPTMAVPRAPQGECARVRFCAAEDEVNALTWYDWFGSADFVRIK
ncbi:serine hydrolase domain-containing protein [Bradyrhizobium sp. HKCCYLS2038]|uniref:serine hydrolase domain-containing protein n=1 Tax=Bradyrhizobium sp. HKCCYLS2038 TaxID=3420764 RepID=UPI003EBBF973